MELGKKQLIAGSIGAAFMAVFLLGLIYGPFWAHEQENEVEAEQAEAIRTALPTKAGIWDIQIDGHDYMDVASWGDNAHLIHSVSHKPECRKCW